MGRNDEHDSALSNFDKSKLLSLLINGGYQSLMLTGGRGAKALYEEWNKLAKPSDNQIGVHVYLTDERCVPLDHKDSNFGMLSKSLHLDGKLTNLLIHPMEASSEDWNSVAERYAEILPDSIDILILSVGEDGHIASLFPYSPALHQCNKRVISVFGAKAPYYRLSVTSQVISCAKKVFVLAFGEEKRRIYQEALKNPRDIDAIPARLVLDRTWIFD